RSESGRGASPDSFFPSFRRTVAQLTPRGNRKISFMKTKSSLLTSPMNRSPLRRGFLLITFAGVLFALSPSTRAVDPPPDGGYPHRNTAEGTDALFNLDTSQPYVSDNTATGFDALFSNTTGFGNTANGSQALYSDTTGGNN